ncbi:MAG: TRAP transporter substrate-binding protein [Thermodesulfobacteriota bacterium]
MSKKWTVVILVMALTVFLAIPASGADKDQKFRYRMQFFFAKGHPATVNSQDYFCSAVDKLSGGRLKITSHGEGELVPTFEMSNAVSKGTIEMATWTPYWDIGKDPVGGILGLLPFGFTEHDYMVWYHEAGGKQYIQKMYDKYNIHVIGAWLSFGQIAAISKNPINGLEDMKGKVMRITGLPAQIVTELGVKTISLPPGELYTALERGTIDLLEFSTPSVNWSFGLHEVGKYVLMPGWQEPCSLIINIINKDAWNKLPDDLKYILEIATDAEYRKYATFGTNDDAQAWKRMMDYGCKTHRFSDEDLKKIYEARNKVLQKFADKDPLFKEVWASQEKFLTMMRDYRKLVDFSFKK